MLTPSTGRERKNPYGICVISALCLFFKKKVVVAAFIDSEFSGKPHGIHAFSALRHKNRASVWWYGTHYIILPPIFVNLFGGVAKDKFSLSEVKLGCTDLKDHLNDARKEAKDEDKASESLGFPSDITARCRGIFLCGPLFRWSGVLGEAARKTRGNFD